MDTIQFFLNLSTAEPTKEKVYKFFPILFSSRVLLLATDG